MMSNNSQSHNGGFLLYTPVIVLRMIRKSISQIKINCVLKSYSNSLRVAYGLAYLSQDNEVKILRVLVGFPWETR